MGVLEWIIAGLIIGALARLLLPGRDPVGCLGTILLGVLGGYVGGWAWEEIFGKQRGIAWIGSIIVAMILLALWRNATYRRGYW